MSGREWLIFEDALRDLTVRPVFDTVVVEVNAGTARVRGLSQGDYPRGFIVDGQKILGTAVLEYVLALVPADEFDDERARVFAERMRRLFGWSEIHYTLQLWVEKRLRDPFFVDEGTTKWNQEWVLRPDADASGIPESFFRFACYVAIGDLKHGPSFASVSANRIFDWVTALGSGLPAQLKKYGTGELPTDLAAFRGEGISAKANDALAIIRIVVTDETEVAYATAIDYLIRLLETTDFPRSYAIEFRGPTKTYLPIKGLPRKGVHQLFACAADYPSLHPALERYARAVMREFEWYQNLEGEDCAMPGTFAVFALGVTDPSYAPLVVEYLRTADGEHQSLQAKFVETYIDTHGFTQEAIAYLLACVGNIQHLRHRKTYPALIANRDSFEALVAARRGSVGSATSSIATLTTNLVGEPTEDYVWRLALRTIWGEDAGRDGGRAIIDRASTELRPFYEESLG